MARAAAAPAKTLQWLRRADPRRVARNIQRRGLWGTLSLVLALAACYGTLALIGLLSALGIGVALNEGLWAASILMLAWLACALIATGMRRHASPAPAALAVAGAALLSYTMLVDYRAALEIAAFAMLASATYYDYRLRRWSRVKTASRGRGHRAAPMQRVTRRARHSEIYRHENL